MGGIGASGPPTVALAPQISKVRLTSRAFFCSRLPVLTGSADGGVAPGAAGSDALRLTSVNVRRWGIRRAATVGRPQNVRSAEIAAGKRPLAS